MRGTYVLMVGVLLVCSFTYIPLRLPRKVSLWVGLVVALSGVCARCACSAGRLTRYVLDAFVLPAYLRFPHAYPVWH